MAEGKVSADQRKIQRHCSVSATRARVVFEKWEKKPVITLSNVNTKKRKANMKEYYRFVEVGNDNAPLREDTSSYAFDKGFFPITTAKREEDEERRK